MFIKRITIKNFRLFSSESQFEIDEINTPDGETKGSGLNVFVGENGSGKTALLDAFALPILEYKAENFGIDNFNNVDKKVEINIYSEDKFTVKGIMPKSKFDAKGFSFLAGIRQRKIKTYLSSVVVNDQKYIRVDPEKPVKDSPDLRVNVNNPFSGKRFTENDILFLDRNRLFQTRSGNFNTTRFDRLMEDFNYQYLKSVETDIADLNNDLSEKIKKDKIENRFLSEAIEQFQEISGLQINLDFLDNYEPFKKAFFATSKENNQQIFLHSLGSGYEMIFTFLYSFYLAQQSGKELIVLIDEPELHLHPRLQEKLVEILLEFSKTTQIFLASHSPLLVKQLSGNENTKIRVLANDGQHISEMKNQVLPYASANEINFSAFNLATEEYHNELYEGLKSSHGKNKSIKKFDNDFFVQEKGALKNYRFFDKENEISLHTFIRNQIHHRNNNDQVTYEDLKQSIEEMREFFPHK